MNFKELEPYVIKNIKEYNASRPDRLRFMTQTQMRDYDAKVTDSEGFDVDDCPGFSPGRISPIVENTRQWMGAQKAAEYAAMDSESKIKHPPLKSVTLIKANHQVVCGLMLYLTFHGLDSRSILATYQSKVWIQPGGPITTCYFDTVVPGSEIQVQKKVQKIEQKKTRPSSSKPTASAFFAYVRSIRKSNPWMTFAQARSKSSLLWRTHLTDSEKNRFVRAAKRQLMKRTPSASKTGI